MKTKKMTFGIIVGIASIFSIWIAKDLLSESNRRSATEVHRVKVQDPNAASSNSWNKNVPDFNPYNNKGLGESSTEDLLGGLLGGGGI